MLLFLACLLPKKAQLCNLITLYQIHFVNYMGLFDFLKKKPSPTEPPVKASSSPTDRQFYPISVAKVIHETSDAVSIYLDIPPHLVDVFAYQAGQYVTLRLHIADQTVLRSYSLSSSAAVHTFYRIAVKRKLGGVASGWLVDHLQRGATLEVFPPLGSFSPPAAPTAKAYFLYAGGSGITPLLSIAHTLLAQNNDTQVILLYANRQPDHIIYRSELDQLAQEYPHRLQLHHIIDQADAAYQGLRGIFTADHYAQFIQQQYAAQYGTAQHFICGPTGMMQAVEQALTKLLQLPSTQVHLEYFDMDKQSTQHAPAAAATTAATNNTTTTVSLTLAGKQYTLGVPAGETILNACLDAGIDAPFMCEAGVCSTCKARLLSGEVKMRAHYSLSDKEVAQGYILCCQAEPQSKEVQINYDI